MMTDITKKLQIMSQSHWYWLVYIVGGLTFLAVALFFQYPLDKPPCAMCIQVRLWFSLFVIVSIAGLLIRGNRILNTVANLSTVLIAVGVAERAYMLLGTERGFIFSDCGFDLGLPAWLAVDEWLPSMYRVETLCGYTPELFFGITMAEMLIAVSALLVLVTSAVFIASIVRLKESD
jgi:disulfide bond formation protein DsbB